MDHNLGLAMWYAVLDATKDWPARPEAVGVGVADEEVVVVRVHRIDRDVFIGTAGRIG